MFINACDKEGWVKSINAFKLRWWRRRLRVLWTTRRSNQSTLKEIYPEYSLEGLMLKLKFQYFAHLCKEPTHWKRPRCWKGLNEDEMVGRHHRLNGHECEQTLGDSEVLGNLAGWVHEVAKSQIWPCDWTITTNKSFFKRVMGLV